MATMMKILVLTIILVGLNGQEMPSSIPDYIHCGKNICINEEGVTCNDAESKCDCPSGEIGNARVQCANPDNHCLCTIQGDPHFCDFAGQTFALLFPCAHKITQMDDVTKCFLVINGLARYRNTNAANEASFEGVVHVLVINIDEEFQIAIKFDGENKPETSGDDYRLLTSGDLTLSDTLDMGGFFVVKIKPCQIEMKYAPRTSTFSLLTPVLTDHTTGLCGDCTERNSTHLSKELVLKRSLENLHERSPIDGIDMNIDGACTDLTAIVKACPKQRTHSAQQYCGPMVTHPEVGDCLIKKLNGTSNLLSEFSECFSNVCTLSICASRDFFDGCAPDNHTLPSFCMAPN